MPRMVYHIDRNSEEQLEVKWERTWKNIEIRMNDILIGNIPNREALLQGPSFPLPDGTVINLQLESILLTPQLKILRNNKPLPRSSFDPLVRLSTSYWAIYLFAIFTLIFSIYKVITNRESISIGNANNIQILLTPIYLLLGYFTQRQSKIALIIFFFIGGVNSIIDFCIGSYTNAALDIMLLFFSLDGINAINQLQKEKE